MTLTEFLLARIAEDEAAARAASEDASDGTIARWRDSPQRDPGQSVVWNGTGQAVVSHAYHYQGDHIARHDPARVLARCEAKRRIVERLRICEREGYDNAAAFLRETVADFAAACADHPDYLPEWKP